LPVSTHLAIFVKISFIDFSLRDVQFSAFKIKSSETTRD